MKTLRITLMAFAFTAAVASSVASVRLQFAWFDSNGAAAGGAVNGQITDPSSGICQTTNTGSACLIGGACAFDTAAHAEADAGGCNSSSVGLLRRP